MKKKALSLLLILVLCLGLAMPTFAASDEATQAANKLNELGLFNGVGNNADGTPNYDLDRAPTRAEAVTLLVRLLGKDAEAQVGTWTTPFTDVADWAKPYVGYAYENELTSGTSATTFGGSATVSATQYLTFVLRAMGYVSGTDFEWDKAFVLTDELEITSGQYDENSAFTRGDAVIVSANALDKKLKDGSKTLLEAIEEALANAPKVPEAGKTVINTFTYSGSAWKEDEAPIGYVGDKLTAKAEIYSAREAVFTFDIPHDDESFWYEVEFKKSWTEKQTVNNGAAIVDVTKNDIVQFTLFYYEKENQFYSNFMMNGDFDWTEMDVVFSDATRESGKISCRVTLPEGSKVDFEMLKDYTFSGFIQCNYS